ncbi:MAG: sodium:solute symporter family protein [Fidelibacterota bacterium]|jgi:SSS family solute:Na+ symporter|tara:strand:- start:1030 stop:3108 length:2079 start_codon:yes stop_codon:yes gene_type:complete
MNLSFIDWLIVAITLGSMIYSVNMTKGLMKSVTDFLSAGRTAGRYLISVSSGVAGLGAISIIMFLEMGYVAGFSLSWWGLSQGIIILAITMSGWVIYRFRSTRCLTLAQFFEKRYSRKFRIFAGIVAFVAGIINFGIFPAVGAQFFINFCELPDSFIGIPMYPLVMFVLLSIALYFVYTGGQIAIIIADFFQGVFVTIVLFIVTIYLFFTIGWEQVSESLEKTPIKLAQKEIQNLEIEPSFQDLPELEKYERVSEINEKYENSSRINPFKTSQVEDFNFWYYLIGIIGVMYGTLGWQGSQGYNSSAKSAHEAKMGSVLAGFRGLPQGLFMFLVPVLVYVLMNHPDYQAVADAVNSSLDKISTDTLRTQLRAPFILSEILPVGLLGAFAALMLAAFISTHDTYLHSWGSIFIQDVIMPFRDKPFDKETHLRVLRYSIFGVAVFIFFFSLLFSQNQKIALYFALTAAIFSGGCGAVIIGGLYWERGTTAAAWTAMIIGAFIGVGGTLVKQVSVDWLSDVSSLATIKTILLYLMDINGQEYWGIGIASSSISYIFVSLVGNRSSIDMDKLLNRGRYSIKGEMAVVNKEPELGWKIFGMGAEFTKSDKLIYILNYVWTGMWTLIFIFGTVYNLSNPVSDSSWMKYWEYYIYLNMAVSIIIIVWFTVGGISDLKHMISSLQSDHRDHGDDGWVHNEG